MKITKRQLRRIIREEKARLLSEQKPSEMSMHDAAERYAGSMDNKTADALQMLQTLNVNLQNIHANTRGEMYDALNREIELLIDAIHKLGGVAS